MSKLESNNNNLDKPNDFQPVRNIIPRIPHQRPMFPQTLEEVDAELRRMRRKGAIDTNRWMDLISHRETLSYNQPNPKDAD